MNRVDQPTADDVILDLLIDGVEPTHENLVVAIAAYPQHRDALVAFFANLAVQTALKDEPAPSGCSVEQFANIGVSRVLVRRHEAQGQTSTDIDDTSGEIEIKSMPPRLSQLIRARGLKLKELMPEKQWEQQYNLAHKIFCDANNLQGFHYPWPLSNVWLGVSVENQAAADERIPDLLATPAAVRWLSCEPLLAPLDLNKVCGKYWIFSALDEREWIGLEGSSRPYRNANGYPNIDWVVVGGESGKDARPMHPDWARSLRDQCEAAGTPFFFKQWGEWLLAKERHLHGYSAGNFVDHFPMQGPFLKVGKKAAGRLLDGKLHDAMPQIGGAA